MLGASFNIYSNGMSIVKGGALQASTSDGKLEQQQAD